MSNTPRIYVACIAAYNAGKLHGVWIDCDQSEEEISEEIQNMLESSPIPDAEEWRIDDTENFYGIDPGGVTEAAELGALIEEYGEAFAIYYNSDCVGVEGAEEAFEEAFAGEWRNVEDWAYELVHETMEIPEYLKFYFDYEKWARDLLINDYWEEQGSNGNTFVFRRI